MAEQLHERIRKLRWMVVFLACLLAGRMYCMQVVQGDDYRRQAERNITRTIFLMPPRGYVMDRCGRILVRNVPRFMVSLLPIELQNPAGTVNAIAQLIGLDHEEKRKLVKTLAAMPADPVKIGKALDGPALARMAEVQSDFPGLYIEAYPTRDYPHGTLAAHVLGHVGEITKDELERLKERGYRGGDIIGKDGLELEYDSFLKGQEGRIIEQVDAAGSLVKRLAKRPPASGAALHLTLDADLQAFSEKALVSTLKILWRKNGDVSGGAVVVMGAGTGEILALASYPTFDPNLFSRGMSQAQFKDLMNPRTFPMLNRAIGAAFPPGSTFKLVTASAALQEKIISPLSGFYCPGYHMVGKRKFNCFVRSGHGSIDFPKSVAQSCDTVFYRLALLLGPERLRIYCRAFGIGSPLGIDLPGEKGGLLPDDEWKEKTFHEQWYDGDTANMAIGQGYLTATPLQIASVTAAVARGGEVYRPFLVRRVVAPGGKVLKEILPERTRTLEVAPEYLAAIRSGMLGAVRYGTAKGARSIYVDFAGKTGTAENARTPENPRGLNHAWFTAFAPYTAPEIVVTVFLEKSGEYGGKWAAPIARRIIEYYYGCAR
jgi:penicillin-binding protein 2